jgi:3-phenylpropionate/trans-cinnamate dioxygenase ferredoxin component
MTEWINACTAEDIDAEDVIRFDNGGRTFAIYRTDDNAILRPTAFAPTSKCTLPTGW